MWRRASWGMLLAVVLPVEGATNLLFGPIPRVALKFEGFVGERIQLTSENWLKPAPLANPGMLGMFQLRDREPAPNLVPWAGEFVGKYLISAIQMQRIGGGVPSLQQTIAQLIASQAEDGYLGPFPKKERLLGHWDLWGHYHCMLALLMWYDGTSDTAALDCVRRAADLVCKTYLDSGRRPIDAGSDEMNLSIIHALGWLYRITAEPRYFRMMREIEKDWERGGDFVRTALAGKEFFEGPRPRWEGLHSLQGLVELYRITGDEKYRRAFEHHWRSIARWDLRNTGGFSSGEQATGNPYAATPIETCCSIAWMALSVDMLKLTGDSRVADLLELATLNAWAGAQHPSGRWCTYNTPMDGVRESSAHSIVFQARAGTPELNCCSVNGPRGWGMLSEWAMMEAPDGYVINWLGPFTASLPTTNTDRGYAPAMSRYFATPTPVIASKPQFYVSGDYPVGSNVVIRLELEHAQEFTLRVRIPEWSTSTRATLNGEPLAPPQAGGYLTIRRAWNSHWRRSDVLKIALDMPVRAVPGVREAIGKVSLYRGPLLLAWDQRFNSFDEKDLPSLDITKLAEARAAGSMNGGFRSFDPNVIVTVPSDKAVVLCDFASAGALGTRYKSWLPAKDLFPGPAVTRLPRDGAVLAPGKRAFRWSAGTNQPSDWEYTLQISASEDFRNPLVEIRNLTNSAVLVRLSHEFDRDQRYFWQVVARNSHGATTSTRPVATFRVDPSLTSVEESVEELKAR